MRGDGCPMCAAGRPAEDEFGIRIYRSDVSDAYLRKSDVGQRGYSLVIWRGRHVAEPTELTADEATSYWLDVVRVSRAIEAQYAPAKLNLMILGNAVPHLHTHVIPRYLDDSAPERPPRFMRVDQKDPAVPEAQLRADADALRRALDDLPL
jgi:diadenosine tetraphosphate (Ap4A) HIT family hydrolase